MAATTISPLFCTLTLSIWFLLGQLLLCPHQVTAQWPPGGGGFWSPSNNNFFNNLNRGILPGGVKLSDLGGFPGAKAGSVTPQGAGRSNDIDCGIEPDPGPCNNKKTMFFYDQQSGRCLTFEYGGCMGNPNKYRTEKECIARCKPPRRKAAGRGGRTFKSVVVVTVDGQEISRDTESNQDPCRLPADKGPCRRDLERLFYNANTGRCEVFIYGGCGGNKNHFRDIASCNDACRGGGQQGRGQQGRGQPQGPQDQGPENRGPQDQGPQGQGPQDQGPQGQGPQDQDPQGQGPDLCELPPAPGNCRQRLLRYYFDARSGTCRDFMYSGCQGNDNSFEDERGCNERCGRGDGGQPDDRDNRGPEQEQPSGNNVCTLPPVRGRCRDNVIRFYYDVQAGICRDFSYSGCDGNRNNFERLADCERECRPARPTVTATPVPDLCFLPPVVGGCRMRLPRVYYDPRAGACRSFTFSGCRGNDNNFNDVATCETRCKPEPRLPTTVAPPVEEVCSLPSSTGPCRARFPRYYYTNGECRQFTYGGCGGNGNNFKDIKDCEAKCKIIQDNHHKDCGSPSDSGRCLGFFRRFFFNRQTRKCETFVYGGCQGNSNNYKTQKECEKACQPPEEPKPREERLIQCPAPNGIAACVDMCRTNSNCGEGQKCCSNGCGRLCIRDDAKKAP